MKISVEVVSADLKNVEHFTADKLQRHGYSLVECLSIEDRGHNGRFRTWYVSTEAKKIAS